MFIVAKDAMEYIKSRSGSVVIDMELQASQGGWGCSSERVAGSYVPKIFIREPLADEKLRLKVIKIDSVKIYYSSRLEIKDGQTGIKIKLRKFIFLKWLELEGSYMTVKWIRTLEINRPG